MGLSEQFVGIDMNNLIGSPLSAATQASIYLAHSTADFIDRVGFGTDGTARRVQFRYQSAQSEPEGHLSRQELQVELPLLSVVPIPNLQIDEVRVCFDMEVKHYEKTGTGRTAAAGTSGGAGFGPAKIAISGNVSSHSQNTRSSDNSAKYEMHITASNHGIPEGLARVLDIMASQMAPMVLGTRLVDESGRELDQSRRDLYQRLRELRDEGARLEQAAQVAGELLESRLKALEEQGRVIRDASLFEARRTAQGDNAALLQEIEDSWEHFRDHLITAVQLAADPLLCSIETPPIGDYLPLRWFAPFTGERETAVTDRLELLFAGAVKARRHAVSLQIQLEENRFRRAELLLGEAADHDNKEK